MRSKKRTYPGSIYADRDKLYIKFKGKRYSTGLLDNKVGRARAEDLIIKMYEDFHSIGNRTIQKPILIKEAFQSFIDSKISRMPKTIEGFHSAFNKIISKDYYLSEDNVEKDIQKYLKTTDNSPVTKNIYLRDLQTFLNYCSKKKWLPITDFKNQYKVFVPTVENVPYSPEEVEALIKHFDETNIQLSLMIQLMLESGARVVDCLTLKWSQVKGDEVVWQNKITKENEIVPISKSVIEIFKKLRAFNPGAEKVFSWTTEGDGFLRKKLLEAFKILNIPRNHRSFQEFRVTFRMSLIEKNLPAALEMKLMRHHDYKVTIKKYTKIEKEMLLGYLEKK